MTVTNVLDSAPRVLVRQMDRRFVLQNERNTMVSGFLKGKSVVFAQTLLTSLMGLCPVSHREVFEAAVVGRASTQSSLRVATEAMLESVRVFCVDWLRFLPDVSVQAETLQRLGQLRQRLFDVLATRHEKQTEQLFVDAQRFVREFQITYAKLLESLLKAVKSFSKLTPISGAALLTPSQWRDRMVLEAILKALSLNRDFAVCPSYQGQRLLGPLARAKDEHALVEPLTPASIVLIRWQELTTWSRGDFATLPLFEPVVTTFENGWRLATVETVRGTLLHAVRTNGAMLEDFHIVAPTEWAFQEGGPLTEAINDFVAKTDLDGKALTEAVGLLVAIFDACTDVQVIAGDAHA